MTNTWLQEGEVGRSYCGYTLVIPPCRGERAVPHDCFQAVLQGSFLAESTGNSVPSVCSLYLIPRQRSPANPPPPPRYACFSGPGQPVSCRPSSSILMVRFLQRCLILCKVLLKNRAVPPLQAPEQQVWSNSLFSAHPPSTS